MGIGQVAKANLPTAVLALASAIPAGVQSVFYFGCLLLGFRITMASEASVETASDRHVKIKRGLRLWTILLAFSFIFLTLELLAQVTVALLKADTRTKFGLKMALRSFGLNNADPVALSISLSKHFIVLFTSSWQKNRYGTLVHYQTSTESIRVFTEERKLNVKFAENVARHLWPPLLLALCLIRVSPLNIFYGVYLGVSTLYASCKPGVKKTAKVIGWLKILHLAYLSCHYTLLLVVHTACPLVGKMTDFARTLKLDFLCGSNSLGKSLPYVGALVFSWVFSLYEFHLKYVAHGSLFGQLSTVPLLDDHERSQTDAEPLPLRQRSHLDRYAFHWCFGFLLAIYSITIDSQSATLLLTFGLAIAWSSNINPNHCPKVMLLTAMYMTFLWNAVYILISTDTCRGWLEWVGLCGYDSWWLQTRLLVFLPLLSIVCVRQTRSYDADSFSWFTQRRRNICFATAGSCHLLLYWTSGLFFPLVLLCLATFSQPHNDVIHAAYFCILIYIILGIGSTLKQLAGLLASVHLILVSLMRILDESRSSILKFDCRNGFPALITNACKLSHSEFAAESVMLFYLIAYANISEVYTRDLFQRFSQDGVPALKRAKANISCWQRKCCSFLERVYSSEVGECAVPFLIVLIIHMGSLKSKQQNFMHLLWTIIAASRGVALVPDKIRLRDKIHRTALSSIAVVNLLGQFLFSAFFPQIEHLFPNSSRVLDYLQKNVGFSKEASTLQLLFALSKPLAALVLLKTYESCRKHRSRDSTGLEMLLKKLAIVHFDKMVACVIIAYAVLSETAGATVVLACYLITLQLCSRKHTIGLLRLSEFIVCSSLIATEALQVPWLARVTPSATTKILCFVVATKEKTIFCESLACLLAIRLNKMRIGRKGRNECPHLEGFLSSWPYRDASSHSNTGRSNESGKQTPEPGRLNEQVTYLQKVSPFYLERFMVNHGAGICALVLLLSAFHTTNIFSIVYMGMIALSMTSSAQKYSRYLSVICSVIALYVSTIIALNAHCRLHISGISEAWKVWLGLAPPRGTLLVQLIPAFCLCTNLHYDLHKVKATEKIRKEATTQDRFFPHICWNEVSYRARKNWNCIEFLVYGFLKYSQDISLIIVLSLAFVDKDIVHLGYLFLSLFYFRRRELLRQNGNRLWRTLTIYNYFSIVLQIAYQIPVFHPMLNGTCTFENLVGVYKVTGVFGSVVHRESRRPISDTLLFIIIQIQSHIFGLTVHRKAVVSGTQYNEHNISALHKIKHEMVLRKKFKAIDAYKLNEARKLRLRWLKGNVLQKESHTMQDELLNKISMRGEEATSPSTAEDTVIKSSYIQSENVPKTRGHTKTGSDLPDQMFTSFDFELPQEALSHDKLSIDSRKTGRASGVPAPKPTDSPRLESPTTDSPSVSASRRRAHMRTGSDLPDIMFTSYGAEISQKALSYDELSIDRRELGKHEREAPGSFRGPEPQPAIEEGESLPPDTAELAPEDATEAAPKNLLEKLLANSIFFKKRIDTHSFVCYFAMCVFFITEFSFMSMIHPLAVFCYALVSISPSNRFWKFVLICMEIWLLIQYVWQVPILYTTGASSGRSFCSWVSDKSTSKTTHLIGLHKTASRCLPGFFVYLVALFQLFRVERRSGETMKELSINENDSSGTFTRKIGVFVKKLCSYHEHYPFFVHIKVKLEGNVTPGVVPKTDLEDALSKYLGSCLFNTIYDRPIIQVLLVEEGQHENCFLLLTALSPEIDFSQNDEMLIHPAYTVSKFLKESSDQSLALTPEDGEGHAEQEVVILDAFASYEDKPDLYVYTILVDLFAYVLVLCGYQAAVSSNRTLSESFSESIFPADYIMTLLGLFFLMLAERTVYILASNRAKFFLHYLSVLIYFIGGMVLYWDRAREHSAYICVFVSVKFCSLAVSSWQMQKGHPKATSGNILLRHYNTLSSLSATAYTAIPFLYELRCLLDWTCTQTTLTLFEWLTFEEIRLTLFQAEMTKRFRSTRSFGKSQPVHVKFVQGLLFFSLLLVVLWTPLLIFSSGSPSFQIPVLNGVNMNATLIVGKDLRIPDQVLPVFDGGHRRSIREARFTPPEINKHYDHKQIQCLDVGSQGDSQWIPSQPSKEDFALALMDSSRGAYISVSWSLVRDHPVTATTCAKTVYAGLQPRSRSEIAVAINASRDNTDTRIPLRTFDPKTSQSTPGIYRLYWQLNGSPCTIVDKLPNLKLADPWVTCDLVLHTRGSQWWEMDCDTPREGKSLVEDPCWDVGVNGMGTKGRGPMVKAMLQEVQSGIIGTFLSSKGITGLYITFVFLIGRIIRSLVANRLLQIPHFELPCTRKLQILCDDVRAARAELDLELEELLYKALIRIYRSTELLYEITRDTKTD